MTARGPSTSCRRASAGRVGRAAPASRPSRRVLERELDDRRPCPRYPTRPFRLGVDIGGTFTDVVLLRGRRRRAERKVCRRRTTTPGRHRRCLGPAGGARRRPDEIAGVVHASTVASNTILEGRGARTALVTTEGFRDVLELRRLRIPVLYDIQYEVPPPLVPRRLVSRSPSGSARGVSAGCELDEALGPRRGRRRYGRPASRPSRSRSCTPTSTTTHERRVEEIVRAAVGDDVYVTRSSEILPEIREYERTSTAVVNAYVGPAISHYVASLVERLHEAGISAQLEVMQSAGGTLDPETAQRRPAHLIESGPSAGVMACSYLGRLTGRGRLISLDMGGTTAKAAIVEDGQPVRTSEYEVGAGINLSSKLVKGGGHPIKLPFIDVSEIGAGGGSIVAVDEHGTCQRRPGQRGSRPGAGVLRHRRLRADAHRRAARARLSRRAHARRRRDHPQQAARARGARACRGGAARALGGGGRARDPAAVGRDDDARGQGGHDLPRPRPARLRAVRIRRQRAAAPASRSRGHSGSGRCSSPRRPASSARSACSSRTASMRSCGR